MKEHNYSIQVRWTGNRGTGTSGYRDYDRAHEIMTEDKPVIPGSSDPKFRGDRTRYNPEELLVAALSSCHMLWYLHLCAEAGIVVTDYADRAGGIMVEGADGGGRFSEVTLRPRVTIRSGDPSLAQQLHEKAHQLCFIANSVNFPVRCESEILIET
jgi:organic hydroperoxide reductase OsmC/OhrA